MKSEVNEMEGGKGELKCCGTVLDLNALSEDYIAAVLSFTSPRDACRLSLVSTTFKSAAESDAVWERFLPSEYKDLLPSPLSCSSKKELYLRLCQNPILIQDGRKSFSLERGSGKKCYMLSARDLFIVWGDTPAYWRWISLPDSRFEEVAELISVCWFEIRGKIDTSMLSPKTHYKAYLVFKSTNGAYGFDELPIEVSVGVVGTEGRERSVYLDPDRPRTLRSQSVPRRMRGYFSFNRRRFWEMQTPIQNRATDDQYPNTREDGWLEVEIGEFFNGGCTDGELKMSLMEVKAGDWKGGIVIQGIEIRPDRSVLDSHK